MIFIELRHLFCPLLCLAQIGEGLRVNKLKCSPVWSYESINNSEPEVPAKFFWFRKQTIDNIAKNIA
jgi:hypothetical protein